MNAGVVLDLAAARQKAGKPAVVQRAPQGRLDVLSMLQRIQVEVGACARVLNEMNGPALPEAIGLVARNLDQQDQTLQFITEWMTHERK